MRTIRSVAAMQRLARRCKRQGRTIGLVPTMGYLHQGHISLVRKARQLAGPKGLVVVSLFVNPTQFGPGEDFSRYPRDLTRDLRLCRAAGVDVVFAPSAEDMYPAGTGGYSTYVVEEELSRTMEGRSRPGHFRGVTTVVSKLFNIILPDLAVFGAKDFQQAAVLKRMVRDLNFPIRMVIAPTVREPDGLAMSSRNKYLGGDLRVQGLVLWQAIRKAARAVRASRQPLKAGQLRGELTRLIERQPAARVDYIEFFDPQTLTPASRVGSGTRMALAVVVGRTRLIDNASL